jgi:cytochrome b subunit of formate dehydrogenase
MHRLHRKPACTDCHFGHPLLSPDLTEFRLPIDDNCGNCHADLYSRYARRMHSTLTDYGYRAAAHCVDCHGSHDILHVNDPHSQLAPEDNRLQTCQKCHTHAVSNFAQFNPHANFKDGVRYPRLHAVYTGIRYSVNIVFACFLIHASLWFIRAFVERMQHGRHTPLASNQFAIPRFDPMQRVLYGALLVAFLGLTFTGLTLKYGNQSWGERLALRVGGFRTLSAWHQFFAMFAIVVFVIYLVRAVGQLIRMRREQGWPAIVLGPGSLVPNGRDFRDFLQMLSWFIGFRRKPGFERWAYWEKLDYWAFVLAAVIIGLTGLAFWFPNLFCLVLSGSILNIAKVVHNEFALYIASFLFLIHFFHAHLRAEKFPMDLSVITGLVSEDHLRRHRPDYIARLEKEGKLSEMRKPPPSRRILWMDIAAGLFVFTLGLWLLAFTILASLEE